MKGIKRANGAGTVYRVRRAHGEVWLAAVTERRGAAGGGGR
jgi:hypothetical protein